MSTYKVLQDIEAEDKLVGALSLRQFIYAAISVLFLWLSFISVTKGAAFLLLIFLPPALFSGFLAVPWHGDQPTEVWALAKLRFYIKPRKRIWNQSGAKELVTITVPKTVERRQTDGLSQTEVRSRLHALANTIDSRGWAVKNVNVNMNTGLGGSYNSSDRLVDISSTLPREVSNLDIRADDDILDAQANPVAQHFDSLISNAATNQRQKLLDQLKQPAQAPQQTAPAPQTGQQPQSAPDNFWFMQQQPAPVPGQATFQTSSVITPGSNTTEGTPMLPQAANPTDEEATLAAQLKAANSQQVAASDHLKHIKTPEELAADAQQQQQQQAMAQAQKTAENARKAQVTSDKRAVIMNLASNDDLDVATLARQAQKGSRGDDGEVVISLR